MRLRRQCLALLAASAAATAIAVSLETTVAGQTVAPAGTAVRTPWGAPDLQGIWSNPVVVPLERSKEFGTREFLTDAEYQKAEQDLLERNQRPGRDSRTIGGQLAIGTEKDVARAYNEHWFGDKPTKVSKRTSQIVDPPDGRVPALTSEAAKRIAEKREYLAALLQGTSGGKAGTPSPRRSDPSPDYNLDRMNRSDGPEDRGGPERCFGNGLPVVMGTGTFGGVMQAVQAPDSLSLYYDIGQGSGFAWVIPITNRPHLPKNIQLYRGDPIAHWEGDTLVADVTNFSDETEFHGSRENLHLVMRFKRADANTLSVQFTADDPTTWTKPWSAAQELEKADEKTTVVLEPGCHEGNYGLMGMLINTRAAEKAFREGKGPDPATQDNATGGGDN